MVSCAADDRLRISGILLGLESSSVLFPGAFLFRNGTDPVSGAAGGGAGNAGAVALFAASVLELCGEEKRAGAFLVDGFLLALLFSAEFLVRVNAVFSFLLCLFFGERGKNGLCPAFLVFPDRGGRPFFLGFVSVLRGYE